MLHIAIIYYFQCKAFIILSIPIILKIVLPWGRNLRRIDMAHTFILVVRKRLKALKIVSCVSEN